MALTLLAGPANAGKVALLLDRYLADLPREPVLIVPTGSDVERVEGDLLGRAGALLGGSIGTFDDVFERIARGNGGRPVAGDAQRALILRRVVAGATLADLGASARFSGFGDALGTTIAEVEAGLLEPGDLDGDLAELYRRYREELDRLGLWDRDLRRAHAADRLAGDLGAWDGRPVYAYGFEDLSGAQWRLLEAFAGRVDVTVSLQYEPGRAVFASLERTATDLARLADGRLEELPPRYAEYAHPALAHLERALFEDAPPPAPPAEGAIRFLEAAGTRATLELVADEVLQLLRSGTVPEEILSSARRSTVSGRRWRPRSARSACRMRSTPPSGSRRRPSATRCSRCSGTPGSGERGAICSRSSARRTPDSSGRTPTSSRAACAAAGSGRPSGSRRRSSSCAASRCRSLERLRSAPTSIAAVRELVGSMLKAAYGLDNPPTTEAARIDLRTYQAVHKLLDELEGWVELGGELSTEELTGSLDRAVVRLGGVRPGHVAIVDLLRARTRRTEVVFVLGLEEGVFPQRTQSSPFLDDDRRRELDADARLAKPDPVSRARYLFYTACTRPSRRLYLVREAATDDGAPRQPSPFWEDVRAVLRPGGPVARDQAPRPVRAGLAARGRPERARAGAGGLVAVDHRPARGRGGRARQRLGAPARRGRSTRSSGRRSSPIRPCSSRCSRRRCSASPSSRRSPAARRSGSSSGCSTRSRWTPRSTHACAARSRTRRSSSSSRACPSGSAPSRSRPSSSTRRSSSCASASPMRSPAAPRRGSSSPTSSAASSSQRSVARPRGARPRRGRVGAAARPAPLRGLVRLRALGARAAARARPRHLPPVREDRPHRPRPVRRPRDRLGLQVGEEGAHRRSRSSASCGCRSRSTCSCSATSSASSRSAGSTGRCAGDRKARGLLRATAKDDGVPGYSTRDYVDEDDFWAKIEKAQDGRPRDRRAHPRRRRPARPARGHVPDVVRARLRCAGSRAG